MHPDITPNAAWPTETRTGRGAPAADRRGSVHRSGWGKDTWPQVVNWTITLTIKWVHRYHDESNNKPLGIHKRIYPIYRFTLHATTIYNHATTVAGIHSPFTSSTGCTFASAGTVAIHQCALATPWGTMVFTPFGHPSCNVKTQSLHQDSLHWCIWFHANICQYLAPRTSISISILSLHQVDLRLFIIDIPKTFAWLNGLEKCPGEPRLGTTAACTWDRRRWEALQMLHAYISISTAIYIYICMYIYVYMYICIYVYMYICIYVYMYICIWLYI